MIGNEVPEIISPQLPVDEDRWAAHGRSPIAAAVIALLGIGAFYFFVQILFTVVGVAVSVHDFDKLMGLREMMESDTGGFEMLVTPLRWAVMLSQYAALLVPTIILIRAWHSRNVARYVRLNAAPVLEIAMAMLGTVLIIPIGATLTNFLRTTTSEPTNVEKLTEQLFTAHSTPEFIFLVIVVAVTPAICEEFFFRGYVQRTFARSIGAHSIPLVGMIFGLFHMQPEGLLTLSMIGMWLGFVYYRSRSLLPNMAAHFTNNFIALWLMYAAPVVFGVSLQDDEQFPLMWALAAIPLLMLVAAGYVKLTAARQER